MRCTFKTVFYVNGSKDRNGIVPIMGRVTINGTIGQFSYKQSVTKAICDILAVFLQSKSIKTRCYDIKRITRLAFVRRNCTKCIHWWQPGNLATIF